MKLRHAAAIDAPLLADLAETCWRSHYTPIIGRDQVDYMLERFQSAEAIARQIADALSYFLIEDEQGTALGYLATELRTDHLFLSKLYILPGNHRRGIGRRVLDELVKTHPNQPIHLTVNKHNHQAICFYEKAGFENHGPIITDIGNGYLMDDWKMVRNATFPT